MNKQFYMQKIFEFDWAEGAWYDFYLTQLLGFPKLFGPEGKVEPVEMVNIPIVCRRKAKEAIILGGRAIMYREIKEDDDPDDVEKNKFFIQWVVV